MIQLMKYTYLFNIKKIDSELEKLWKRYQKIITNPKNYDQLNEARAILYLTGQIYCEQIAPKAIERRLSHLKKPLTLIEFFTLIDKKSPELEKHRKDKLFKDLESFYNIIKKYKNKNIGGKHYLDEEKFIVIYNKFAKNEKQKTSYKGFIDLKKNKKYTN